MKKENGYTLLELVLITGVIGLAGIGLYEVYRLASDWAKSNSEVQSLSLVIRDVSNSVAGIENYKDITLESLNNYSSNFNSKLNLRNIDGSDDSLSFKYENLNTRVCNIFSGKMLESSKNIHLLINEIELNNNSSLVSISDACEVSGGSNDVTVVLTKTKDNYTISNVVASINPEPIAPIDIVVPNLPTPKVPPIIVGFIPNMVNTTEASIGGSIPTFNPIAIENREILVTPGKGGVIVNQPNWVPPVVIIPGATPAPADNIDQDPNPPPKKDLEWLGDYNLQSKIVSYLCRVSCWALPMDNSTIGGVSKFLNNFELRVGGTTIDPKMETITKEKYEELAQNGYVFYFAGIEQVGPSNWGQYRNTYIICKKPSSPRGSEYGGIIINCS